MASMSQRQKGREGILSTLDGVIQILNLAKDTCGIPPAQIAFGSAGALLTMIRDSLANKQDYIDLGLSCADVCKSLDRGLKGRRLDELGQPMLEAIEQLTTTIARIQMKIVEQGNRNAVSQAFHAKNDKDTIAAWRQDLNRILHIFNTELAINTHMLVVDIHRTVLAGREGAVSQHHSIQTSVPLGESPPPPPRACFGRDELIERIVDFAENFEPIALIGAGGIGKTSIALAVLHHDRVKDRFGDYRRFIRCDQFPTSRVNFLAQLSRIVGAGIENPEDLAPLRSFLSSRDMILFLDNAESILDPQGTDSRDIYLIVEELSRFGNICLGITSRISTVPPHCKRLMVPALSMGSACDIFYTICSNGGRLDIISNLVRKLDFHPLSITLLATTASHNMWDYDRLAKEWDTHRVQVLQTDHNESLAATIELSLASPTFCQLIPSSNFHILFDSPSFSQLIPSLMFRIIPPSARELLRVVAFFPQGIDEKNLDWLFPTIPDRKIIFDKFCVLSLTHRNDGFITMLAPMRDYLRPQHPTSSPLLRMTKDRYFARLSVDVDPNKPGFEDTRWITSEDVNVEHLLDVFTSVDMDALDVWDACGHFINHLYWHKPRQTMLTPKIGGLPDDHHSKAECLFQLSKLFGSTGNHAEKKRLLTHTLALERRLGNRSRVARTLRLLSDVNRVLGFLKEGIRLAEEASEIYKRLGNTLGQAYCLYDLAHSLLGNQQLSAAEEAALRTIDLLPEKGQDFLLCQSHHVLGEIYRCKGEKEKAIDRFEAALGIASPSNWQGTLFWIHYDLAMLFFIEGELEDANTHIERAKSNAVNDAYTLGRALNAQARVRYRECRVEEASSTASCAMEIFEGLGATQGVEDCRKLLRKIEQEGLM